jgi:hypothetical protein
MMQGRGPGARGQGDGKASGRGPLASSEEAAAAQPRRLSIPLALGPRPVAR